MFLLSALGAWACRPAWYKARAYRARVVVEPRAVLAEFGTELPQTTEIRVHDSTADMRYMVSAQAARKARRAGARKPSQPRSAATP